MRRAVLVLPVLVLAAGAGACTGSIADSSSEGAAAQEPRDPGAMNPGSPGARTDTGGAPAPGAPAAGPALPARDLAALVGLRRLTSDEYDNTVRDLLGDTTRRSHEVLPDDPRNPFDNDYTQQIVSKALVEGLELLARDTSTRLLADPARRDRIVGCKPAGATDATCLRQFVTRFGRRALRRTLTETDVQRYMRLQSVAQGENDFYAAVDAVLRAFLSDPEFIHRVEIGTPIAAVPGVYRLNKWELASRLSYFLWGSMPPDGLLDRAERGELATPEQVRSAAAELLGDARARGRIGRFHAMWMGYETLPHDSRLANAMTEETSALLDLVIFQEKRPWQDVFRNSETFVSYDLAKFYGLRLPPELVAGGKPMWVSYQGTARRGLLSQGSFLSLGAKFMDTSPTVRGKGIRELLFCEEIKRPPPDLMVDVDEPPKTSSPCKWDRYLTIRQQPGCATCHSLTDLVGFGLENYDAQGRFRTVDKDPDTRKDLPQCSIRGEGEIVGTGTFKGPGELGELMLRSGVVNGCVITQLYRFAVGRQTLDETDRRFVALLLQRMGNKDFRFDDLVLELVSADAFAHRRVDRTEN